MRGFLIDTVHGLLSLEKMNNQKALICSQAYIWAGLKTTPCSDGTVASAVIDGGTLRFIAEPFKREQSN